MKTKYLAEIGGQSWAQGPTAGFNTIRECRDWAEDYEITADWCRITHGWKVVAVHRRYFDGGWKRVARRYGTFV